MSKLSNPTPTDALYSALRTDLSSIAAKTFSTLNPGRDFHPGWHHYVLAHQLDQCSKGISPRLIINVPPRSLKSTLISIAYVAFELGGDPTRRFLCLSYSQELANKFSLQFRQVVQSEWFRRAFPGTQLDRVTVDEVSTTAGGYRKAISIGGSLTGWGGDTIIIDDPLKPEEAYSQTARDRVNEYFGNTLYSRLDHKETGRIILVMQRLHQYDLTGFLIEQGDFKLLKLPAIAVEDEELPMGNGQFARRRKGDVLEARESLAELEKTRRRSGEAHFQAQYQQDPAPAEGNMIKAAWIAPYEQLPPLTEGVVWQSWDTALTGNPSSSYSCCTTWLQRDGEYYLMHVFRDKLEFPDLKKKAVELNARFRPEGILVEAKGSGISLSQELRVGPHFLHVVQKPVPADKVSRLAAVAAVFEARAVRLPRDASWLHDYTKEILGFPAVKADDQVDSTSQFLNHMNEHRESFFKFDIISPGPPTGAPHGSFFLR